MIAVTGQPEPLAEQKDAVPTKNRFGSATPMLLLAEILAEFLIAWRTLRILLAALANVQPGKQDAWVIPGKFVEITIVIIAWNGAIVYAAALLADMAPARTMKNRFGDASMVIASTPVREMKLPAVKMNVPPPEQLNV